ncbi:hypothetical protein EMCRGX_G022633 [Ephydatia muelleri]
MGSVGETATLLDKARTKTLEGLTLDHKEVLVTGVFFSRIDPLEKSNIISFLEKDVLLLEAWSSRVGSIHGPAKHSINTLIVAYVPLATGCIELLRCLKSNQKSVLFFSREKGPLQMQSIPRVRIFW